MRRLTPHRLRRMAPFFAAGLFLLALRLLHHQLTAYRWEEIRQGFAAIFPLRIAAAFALTLASYTVLTGHDFLAVRYIGRSLPYRRIALASYLGYVLSHNIGVLLGATAPRYRIYSAAGLAPGEVARVFAFTSLGFWVGWVAIASGVLLLDPGSVPLPLPLVALQALGAIFAALVALYVAAAALCRGPVKLGSVSVALPSAALACAQVALSIVDWLVASAVLWVLLPAAPGLSYGAFLAVFLTAVMAGLLSHVPGGLGVFESVFLVGLSRDVPGAAALGALGAFRAIYYLVPLGVAGGLFATYEGLSGSRWLRAPGEFYTRWVSGMVPSFLATTTFAAGVVLLLSGATPAIHGRLSVLRDLLPLPVMEISHFLGSLAGLGLLLLAGALQRRVDAAYHLAAALLGGGAVLSLLKGLDYEEATLLTLMLAALLGCRAHFYRHSTLLREPFSPGWALAVAAAVAGAGWVGFFAHRHVEYSQELWWRFTFDGDAPRFLRAGIGVVVGALTFTILRLLRPLSPAAPPPSSEILERVRAIVDASPRSSARLALLGDKSFLLGENGRSFVMYGVSGRSWVSMGDPVGNPEEQRELVWRFCEECDRYAAWPVFYEAGPEQLPVYLEVGLTPLKIGENARVALADFSLEGSARKEFRYVRGRAEREHASFEIVEPAAVAGLLPELAAVSDAWLTDKNTREKSFSIGSFKPEYLCNFPIAVVRREGAIVAFANVWLGANGEELSPDLMRYGPGAPYSAMDYLFVELMLWGKSQGYRWFNMGGAPFSGLRDHPLAPLWHRAGTALFHSGEHFYNFQGLRAYKEKYAPVWQPLYLVSPGGLSLPRIVANVAGLVSGGISGVVAK